MKKVLVIGSVALDNIKTPFGSYDGVLGGSAIHASVAASIFTEVDLIGVAGNDFSQEYIDMLNKRKINTKGLKILNDKKTFHWQGYYEYDMNQAHTIKTDLNVLAEFEPDLTDDNKNAEFVFLANLDPKIQLSVLNKLNKPKLVVLDTMNFWISSQKQALLNVISKVDLLVLNEAEARQLTNNPNLIIAAKEILKTGVKKVIIKKGEHGSMLFSNHHYFVIPSYPVEKIIDPTGAGDSFAGALIGYLAKNDDISQVTLRKALVLGSVVASYNVEDFSVKMTSKITKENIQERYQHFKQITEFEGDF